MLALGPEDLLLVLALLGPEGLAELQGQLTQGLGPVPSGTACRKTRVKSHSIKGRPNSINHPNYDNL